MNVKRLLALIFTVALPVLLLTAGIFSIPLMKALKPEPEKRADAPKALAVFVKEAERRDTQLNVNVQGEVAPRNQAQLAPQVPGRVSFVAENLVAGGIIKKGQLLMRIEDADYRLSVIRAESSVASAQQALTLTIAEADLARRELEDLGITDPSPLALKEPQLEEARAALAAAEAQLEDAKLQLRRTGVYAPFDGRVLSETVDIGQFVGAGSPIATAFATDVMEVELQIPDSQMGELGLPIAFNATPNDPGPEVLLKATVGGRDRQWNGTVTRTGAAVNSRTRLVSVYAEVQDPFGAGADGDAPLAPGLFVNAIITGRAVEDIIVIPRNALRGLSTVYAVETIDAADWRQERIERLNASGTYQSDADKEETAGAPESPASAADLETGLVDVLRIRTVEVLKSTEEESLILSGIEAGERVVLSPIQEATEGMRLRILTRSEDGSLNIASDNSAPDDLASNNEGSN